MTIDDDSDAPVPGALADVIARLAAALPELTEATCTRIHQTLDAYAGIDRDALAAAVDRNMRTSLEALRTGLVPDPGTLGGAAQTASERFASGLRVEEIVRGFRISIALIHELFVDLAIQVGLPADQVVEGSRLMWGVGDSFTTRIITEYHELEVGSALRDAQRRISLMKDLLTGVATAPARAQLDPHRTYAVLRCDVSGHPRPEAVRRSVESSGSSGQQRALVVLDGDDCLGIVARRPEGLDAAAGLGPFVAPPGLARSDAVAQECLALARHLGRTGAQSPDDLGWRLAAASRRDVWTAYRARYIQPLLALGTFGQDVLRVVDTWLHEAQSVGRTAADLSLHVNTVRYRLARFEEVTGADLTSLEDRIGVVWALEMGDPDTFEL